jgi:hypothetical protein
VVAGLGDTNDEMIVIILWLWQALSVDAPRSEENREAGLDI